ncbi:hypothetical protein SNE40_011651 [Patella caerulea]|uniref:Uncharacterized protein n=1 Tax=Patella caerulea TaxID=87958 RepID=A0AAN8PJ31_PATCE
MIPRADTHLTGIDMGSFDDSVTQLVTDLKDEFLHCAFVRKDSHKHGDDYLEFINLSCAYLNGDNDGFGFRRPGAMHKDRWMSKLIYCLKVCLKQTQIDQLPPGTITTRQQTSNVRDFTNYMALGG